jgi:hypothetical protein
MPSFWAQVETVETRGSGNYPDGMEDLLLCTEHHWTYSEFNGQPAWHIDRMLKFRNKKILGENYRAKKAARKK